jgi:hypothetical protein
LTPAQQQTAIQILVQISLEMLEATDPEVRHEHP